MEIDLHIHTTMSDGALTPKQVIDTANKNGVKLMSISDHDTTQAYTDELFKYAESKGIKLIPGIEISTRVEKAGVHVLGYNYNWKDQEFQKKLYEIRNARHIYLHEVGKKLSELGYKLNIKALDKIDSVTKAHIALDIVSSKDNEDLLLKNFGYIPNKGEFIETVMNKGCPAYVVKKQLTPKEATELIRSVGGKVVLAHPVAYIRENKLSESDIQDIVDSMNPDGIEANYIYVSSSNKIINEIEKWKKFAKENNKFITCGSDFHKSDGIRPEIGFANFEFEISDEEAKGIFDNFTKSSQN